MTLQSKFISTVLAVMCMGQMLGVIMSSTLSIHKNSDGTYKHNVNDDTGGSMKYAIQKAGFFDPRSYLSFLAFTQTERMRGGGQYFNFGFGFRPGYVPFNILKVDEDEFELTDLQIKQLYGMLMMVNEDQEYKDSLEYKYTTSKLKDIVTADGHNIQQWVPEPKNEQLATAPLVIPRPGKRRTYIIDVQYKNKSKEGSLGSESEPAYYFVLGISENGEIAKTINDRASTIGAQDVAAIKDLLKTIPFTNPYVSSDYKASDSTNGLTLEVRTGGRLKLEESINVELDETDLKSIFNLIKEYNTNKSATYTKSFIYLGSLDNYSYRITFHFDGEKIYILPVYKS